MRGCVLPQRALQRRGSLCQNSWGLKPTAGDGSPAAAGLGLVGGAVAPAVGEVRPGAAAAPRAVRLLAPRRRRGHGAVRLEGQGP